MRKEKTPNNQRHGAWAMLSTGCRASLSVSTSYAQRLLLLLTILVTGATGTWAEEVTFNSTAPSDAVNLSKMTSNGNVTDGTITISNTSKDGWQPSNTTKHASTFKLANNSGSDASTLTVSCSNGNITQVVLNYEGNSDVLTAANVGNLGTSSDNVHTWTGEANSVTFTGNSSKAVYITSIVVTYTADAPAPTTYTLKAELFGHGASTGLDWNNQKKSIIPTLGNSVNDTYYDFNGWFTNQACTDAVAEGTALSNEPTTLYAKWTKKTLPITTISSALNAYFSANDCPTNQEYFDWYGNIQNIQSEGTEYANAASGQQCSKYLKLDSKGSLRFNLASASTVNLYFADNQTTEYKVNIDGTDYSLNENSNVSVNLAAGEHIIKKASSGNQVYLLYIDIAPVTYNVTYNLNGGTGTAPTQAAVAEGAQFTVASGDGITKDGYTFNGWNDGTANYAAGSTYAMGTSDVTLTAQWLRNSPTGTVSDLVEINSDYKFIPSEKMYKDHLYEGNKLLTLLGDNDYSNGAKIKENRAIAFNVAANAVIKVKARSGGSDVRKIQLGTALSSGSYDNLATQDVPSGGSATLTYKYDAGGIVYLTSNSELYMQELEILFSNGYTVTYVHNGHGQHADYVVPDVFALPTPLPTPTAADGYTFVGWYNDNSTFTSAPAAGENLSADKTLYAKWMINKGNNVKLDGNGITTTLTELVQPQTSMAIALPSAYETAENVNIPGDATWNVATGSENAGLKYGNYYEAYYGNKGVTSVPVGDVLTQSISVANGKYEVILDVAASATNIRNNYGCPTGKTLTQAFAGTAAQYIPVIDRTELDPEADYDRVVLVAEVTNGTLTYGIKNVEASGNWYICRVHSIKKIDDSNFNGWYDAKTGGNKIGDAGYQYTPESNNTTIYAQWNKTYTFRPIASNGTISSVTVNGEVRAMENNHDYKINENSSIVMTVAPADGYKFKNWVVTGTAGTENGMTYTISAINADTKLTAKFEALGDATDPNPANGTLENGTVTINPFPASYAGNTQTIDLNLPTGATFTVTSDNASNVEGKLSVVAPNAQQSTDVTIQVTAENGTTEVTYIVHVSTVVGESFSYTVNAVDGSANVLETLSEGIYAQGTGELKLYHPKYVKSGNKLYGINANKANDNPGWFVTKFTPQSEADVINITYNDETVDNVVFYSEGENCLSPRVSNSTTLSRASSGVIGRGTTSYQTITTLPTGTYKFVAAAQNGNSDAFTYKVAVDGVEVLTHDVEKGNEDSFNGIFKVSKTSEISINSTAGSAGGIDWLYIQDLGVLPILEDGQEEYLTKAGYEAHLYFTSSKGGWDATDKTEDGVTGKYMSFNQDNADVQLKTNGAYAFEVFVDANNNDKKFNVKVGTGSDVAYTVKKGLQSSGIIATGSNTNDIEIKISKNNKTSLWPVKVKFYTKPLIVGAETTITMGKGAQSTDLNVVGGTAAQLVTPSAQASAIVSGVKIEGGKLYATPVKAGVANLTINIVDNESNVLNTVDYVVNVIKQQVTMTYLAGGKDSYHVSDGTFASPTVLIEDAEGNDITSTVNTATPIIYISDDETLVKYNNLKQAELIPNVQGVAKLKAVLYNNPVYEDALATFTVNVSAGIDMKLYTMGTDSKGNPIKVGNAEPAINSTLVAEQDGKVLMTMTYGGYKYQDNLTEQGGYKYTDSKGTHYGMDRWEGKEGKFSAYNGQGKDIYGQAFDNQIDDFGFQVQAKLDSRDEYGKGIQWYTTNDVKPDGTTHYTAYERIKPFSLPVKGAYLKFEAEVNGTLTAYVLQNGNITFSDETGHVDEPDAADPLGGNPRIYYWFNQDGYRIDPTSFSSKQPLTIGRDYNAELTRQINEWFGRDDLKDLDKYFIDQNAWPVQAEVNANLQKPVPTPQTVVRYQEGYMVAQKAYVKYVVPVVAGDTYYFFSNASKVGAAGFNFQPAEDGTVDLILPEEGGIRPTIPGRTIVANEGKKALNCTADVATTHKTTASIDMYKEVTLPRKFKVNTWSTICLPFHVTETQVERVFGKGTSLVIYNGISEGGKARFQKHVNQDILAGQPYLIYPTGVDAEDCDLESVCLIGEEKWIGGEHTSITFTNVNFTPNIAVQSYCSDKDGETGADGYGSQTPSFNFIGTLAQNQVKQYDYYVNNNSGALTRYTGKDAITLNAYYAYLKVPEGQNARAFTGVSFGEIDDDENVSVPTGIMDVMVEMGCEIRPVNGVFNLSGQKVAESTKNLPKGIYIINGQKVNIK